MGERPTSIIRAMPTPLEEIHQVRVPWRLRVNAATWPSARARTKSSCFTSGLNILTRSKRYCTDTRRAPTKVYSIRELYTEYISGPEAYWYLWPLMTGSNDIPAARPTQIRPSKLLFGGVLEVGEPPPSFPPVKQTNVMGMFLDWMCVEWCW